MSNISRDNTIYILGAGIGGLTCASYLAKEGYKVTILEQNNYCGGKAAVVKINGFTFDAGPSLLTLPEWIDDHFKFCGKNPRDYFKYEKLDPVTRYFFNNNQVVDVAKDLQQTATNFEKFLSLNKTKFLKYMNKWKTVYELSEKTFLKEKINFNLPFFKAAMIWFSKIGFSSIFQSMASYNRKSIGNKEVELIMNRFATYSGSSPYLTPAFMNQIAVIELCKGAFFPKGGIYSIVTALEKLCSDLGVKIIHNRKITKITLQKNIFQIETNQEIHQASTLVSNIDFHTTQLLLDRKIDLETKQLSTSALVFYWGIKQNTPQFSVHNIFFSSDYKKEFETIFQLENVPQDPTIYINISSKKEKDHAPSGMENWFVMVNLPAIPEKVSPSEIDQLRSLVIKHISKKLNLNLQELIDCEEILTPKTLYEKTGSYKGALYGINQHSLKRIMSRSAPKDRELDNLYYAGGSVHPGGGIPLALISGIHAAKEINQNK